MERNELRETATSLWDGGWRVEDKNEMKKEYTFTDEELEIVCEKMKEIGSEIDWKMTEEIGDHDTIGRLKDGRFFWTWNTGEFMEPETLLEIGDENGENGGMVFASLEEILEYLQDARGDLAEFVKENF